MLASVYNCLANDQFSADIALHQSIVAAPTFPFFLKTPVSTFVELF